MPKKKLLPPPARKPRADARRNRERILEVAKEAFTRDGAAASLDDIARRSNIGSGTLYRHFPTRDALIEAVYRSEVEKLAAAEQRFATTMPPLEALRAWMLLFIDHVSEKRLIIPAMDTVAGAPSPAAISAPTRTPTTSSVPSSASSTPPRWPAGSPAPAGSSTSSSPVRAQRQSAFLPYSASGKNSEAPDRIGACSFHNRIAISRSPASGTDT
jgi:Bacterial regulatory proteins, tetR family